MKPIHFIVFFIAGISFSCSSSPQYDEINMRTVSVNGDAHLYLSSSELAAEEPGKFSAVQLFDEDPTTAWSEGAEGNGTGEYILLGLGNYVPTKIEITNGYQKSEKLFRQNGRVKALKISMFTGFHIPGDVSETAALYRMQHLAQETTLQVDDGMGTFSYPLPFDPASTKQNMNENLSIFDEYFQNILMERGVETRSGYFLKIEILEVYPGEKYEDVCISDLSFDVPDNASSLADKVPGVIKEVYADEDPETGKIWFDTDLETKVLLLDKKELAEYATAGEGLQISLMDVSPDKKWAQVDIMISEEDAPRVEEYSALYYVPMKKRVDSRHHLTKIGVYGFTEKEGISFLETAEGDVNLAALEGKMEEK